MDLWIGWLKCLTCWFATLVIDLGEWFGLDGVYSVFAALLLMRFD